MCCKNDAQEVQKRKQCNFFAKFVMLSSYLLDWCHFRRSILFAVVMKLHFLSTHSQFNLISSSSKIPFTCTQQNKPLGVSVVFSSRFNQLIFILLSCGRENTQFITFTTNTSAINSGFFFLMSTVCLLVVFFFVVEANALSFYRVYICDDQHWNWIYLDEHKIKCNSHACCTWVVLAFYANEKMPLLKMLFCKCAASKTNAAQAERKKWTSPSHIRSQRTHSIEKEFLWNKPDLFLARKNSNGKKCNTQDAQILYNFKF